MGKVLDLFILGAALALLKLALQVLVVALLLSVLFAFATRPRETLVFVGGLTLCGLACARPTAAIICLGVVSVIGAIAGRSR